MERIIRKAMQTSLGYEGLALERIMEVLAATGNPQIAAEIMLGVYEEPQISQYKLRNKKQCKFVSYNKWNNMVTYEYEYEISKSRYIFKCDKEHYLNCPLDEFLSLNNKWKDDMMSLERFTGEFKVTQDSCELGYWLEAEEWFPSNELPAPLEEVHIEMIP